MSKADLSSSIKASIIQGQDAALQAGLESMYDGAFAEGVASVPPADADEQTKIDAAVQAQKDADQVVIDGLNAQISKDAQDLSDAQAKALSDLAALQVALDAMTQKEQLEEQAVADVKAKIDSVQASFDAIRALFP
jgi:hypothetical protein